jgi:large subunit ribosomal protein L16
MTSIAEKRFMSIANFRPKKTRHKKVFKGTLKIRESSLRGTRVYHGDYGLQLTKGGRLKDKQLDTARGMIRRAIKGDKGSKFFLRLFPHRPVTCKGSETRMGKGKGTVESFATWARAGDLVFEVKGARMEIAYKALKNAAACLPLSTRIVKASELKVAPRTLPHFIRMKLDRL